MLLTADWVLPVSKPPIRAGGVLVDGDRIASVDRAADLAGHPLAIERHDFPGHVITPGLVNAHTHLTLTALSGVIAPAPFAEWLPRLVAALKPWDIADHEASGIIGAEESLLSGVTVVGDIAYGAAEVASASAAGLGGVYYWELLGISANEVADRLDYLRYPPMPETYGPRVICGLSPHSPYTSGPELLRAVHDTAGRLGVPVATHVAESAAEIQLMRDGTGPLAPTASRTALGFEPPGLSPVAYLDSIGALEGITAVHLCHILDSDIPLLAERVRGAVTCPRSNRFLSNPVPRIGPLLEAGIAVGVGTDSSASNSDLDLLEEVRALGLGEPSLDAATLLRLATLGGATAIGVSEHLGSLDADKFADVAVLAIEATTAPESLVIQHGGRSAVSAVMSGGTWRVRDGELLATDDLAAARALDARTRSAAALAQR